MHPNYQITDRRRLPVLHFAQATVGVLIAPAYRAVFNARRRRYLSERAPVEGAPVVAIGNVSLGGTGKTPVACTLYEHANAAGLRGAVVLKLGKEPLDFLDELLIYAGRLGELDHTTPTVDVREGCITVSSASAVVCAHRNKLAGVREMAARNDLDFVIADDAHQLYSLQPALSICLLRPEDAQARLFPAGMLREEITASQRADIVLVRDGSGPTPEMPVRTDGGFGLVLAEARPLAKLLSPWLASRATDCEPEAGLPGARAIAFAGIGRPEGFERTLARLNANVAKMVRFPDHYQLATRDLRMLEDLRRREGAECFITTEKDGSRLLPLMLRARYAEGHDVCWPAGLLPRPEHFLPDLITAAQRVWERAYYLRMDAQLPDAVVQRFMHTASGGRLP
jgi:tetraacyldisaccharide 4'-kinase